MDKINFNNLPSTSTAVSAENLNLLQSNVEKALKNKNTSFDLERIFRFLDNSAIQSMQGGCITPNGTIIVAMWQAESLNNKIMEINYTTGAVLKTSNATYGWCNGLAFDSVRNLVYVAPRGAPRSIVGNDNYYKTIHVLSYSDFSLIDTITMSDFINSVYYDKENDKLYAMNELFKYSPDNCRIYELDTETYTVVNTINLNYSDENVNKIKVQNFCVADNQIFILSSEPRALIAYDMNGQVLQKFNLPEYVNDIYYAGEYQFIDKLNNDFYVGTGDNIVGINESINQIFKFNFDQGKVQGTSDETSVHAGSSYTVFVDASSTSINPDGSENNKFKSINEATRCIIPNRGCTVSIADGTYTGVYLRSRDHIEFSGNSQNVIIKGFNINYCSHVVINNATISNCEFDQSGAVNILYSTVYLKTVSIQDAEDRIGINVGQFSQCTLSVSVSISVTNDNQIYVRNDSVLITNATTYKIQKHHKASKILGSSRPKLFDSDVSYGVGEFALPSRWSYTGYNFANYFTYGLVHFTVGGDTYVQRIALGVTQYINLTFMTNGSTQVSTQVLLDFNNSKLRLRYSRVFTRGLDGTCTAQSNSNNDSLATNSVVIKNIYFE